MNKCKICNSLNIKLRFSYDKKPSGETNFNIDKKKYYREFFECKDCGHMFADMKINISNFYKGSYTQYTYGKDILEKFQKIINLPLDKSDNEKRTIFIKKASEKILKKKKITLLDIGSGLGVFPWRAKKENWEITALDPDPVNIQHIKKNINVHVIEGDFLEITLKRKFHIVTFNKVLEHIEEPKEMILKAKSFIKNESFIYAEVPHINAANFGKNREEFFIEHLHVFSEKSLKILANDCGFNCLEIDILEEPSGKYTMRAVLNAKKKCLKNLN